MAVMQNFRSAFNGFNREDVVRYIEYVNSRHTTEVNQLKSELDLLQKRMQEAPDVSALEAELEALRAERDALQAKVTELESKPAAEPIPTAMPAFSAAQELETYRRAERMERVARERAEQLYQQANAVLADATVKVDSAVVEIDQVAASVMEQLNNLQAAVNSSKQILADAAATMYTIRPTDAE